MDNKELRGEKRCRSCKDELNSLLKAHFSLRMQQATQQLTNTSELTQDAARDRARAHDYRRESEAGMSEQTATATPAQTGMRRRLTGKWSATRWTRPSRCWSSAG